MKKLAGLLLGMCFVTLLTAQPDLKPSYMVWKADGKDVSVKSAYEAGIEKPDELAFSVFFDNALLKKYAKEDFTLEFRWFYYYSTTREFMNKQTITFEGSEVPANNTFSVSSTRKNIQSGWWEVIVTIKKNNQSVEYDGVKRFQIYVK